MAHWSNHNFYSVYQLSIAQQPTKEEKVSKGKGKRGKSKSNNTTGQKSRKPRSVAAEKSAKLIKAKDSSETKKTYPKRSSKARLAKVAESLACAVPRKRVKVTSLLLSSSDEDFIPGKY